MNTSTSLHRLTQAGLIAALYTVLTLLLPIASFGPVQLRFSEILTVLPVFSKRAVVGLTLGCAIANAIGVAMGANVAGVWDILLGSTATLLASVISYALRNRRIKGLPMLSVFSPVVVNAVIIGLQLCIVYIGEITPAVFALTAAQVGVGQLLPCVAGGLILFQTMEKTGLSRKIFRNP